MKLTFISNFAFYILFFAFCACQSKPPAQDSQTNQPPLGGGKMKQEATSPTPTSMESTKKSGMRYFVNCPYNITVKNGETFQIKMHAVAGTGFLWTMATESSLVSLNHPKETVYEAEPNDTSDPTTPKVGGKKVQVLEFTASKVGTGNLTLLYARPWEKDKEPAEKCVIALKVE